MAKRSYKDITDDNNAEAEPSKRKKDKPVLQKQPPVPASAETITSAEQLQDLLGHSTEPVLLRHGLFWERFGSRVLANDTVGIQSLKLFLESIDVGTGGSEQVKLRSILREYLESQKGRYEDVGERVYMENLMQAWAFASQSNNNSLLSAIPSVLARLLKTVSYIDEFRPNGIHLCKTLLQSAQLKLIARNLTANNEYIISPSLRLLTEIVSFDGGSQAKSVIAHREFTFKGLGRNLKWISKLKSSDKKEPVRTSALRYLLANFKFQNSSAKGDLAGQRDIISALLKNIRDDPPDIIVNILSVLKQDFVLDEGIQRSTKSRLLSPWALGRLASLYGYVEPTTDGGNAMEKSVESAAHEFLLFVCTTPGLGVLLPDFGWYPPGSSMSHIEVGKEFEEPQDVDFLNIRLELDHLEESRKYQEKIPVRNSTLSAFVQELRPHINTLQSKLLLAIFKAAPELVADYYLNKRGLSFESKLTSTWIGYSAFLFSTVQLPVPKFFNRRESISNRPPPIPIVIENILPQPLNQKVLTKCLNQNTKLIKFFAIRLLCEAFQKLETILDTFSSASAQNISMAWKQASSGLLQEFHRRCPKMKDIITVFRSMAEEDILQREAVARLLAMYYRVVPEIALNERFDASVALGDILKRIEVGLDNAEDLGTRMLELEHLLYVAQCSPDIRWWNKPESLSLSAFTHVLKLLVKAPSTAPLAGIKALILSIVYRTHHLQEETLASPLDALVNSLRPAGSWEPSDAVFKFLDNSIVRYARASTKYYDSFVSILSEECGGSYGEIETEPVSLLLMTLVDQWPFLSTSAIITDKDKENVARWLARYLAFSFMIRENVSVLHALCKRLINAAGPDECRQVFQALSARLHGVLSVDIPSEPRPDHTSDLSNPYVSAIINTDWQVQTPLLDHVSSKLSDAQGGGTAFDLLLAQHIAYDSWRKDSLQDRIAADLIEKTMRIMEEIILKLRRTGVDRDSFSNAQKLLCLPDGLMEIFFRLDVNKKFRARTLAIRKGYTNLLQAAFEDYSPELKGVTDAFVAGFHNHNIKDSRWHQLITSLNSLIHLFPLDSVILMARATIDEGRKSSGELNDKSAMLLTVCLKKLLTGGGAIPEELWRKLICLPIGQKSMSDADGSLIWCMLENVGREGAIKALTPGDIGTLSENVRHGYGSAKILCSIYLRLLNPPGQSARNAVTYDPKTNELFQQLLEDGKTEAAIDILEMRLSTFATADPGKGWRWKENITKAQIQETKAQYTRLHNTLLKDWMNQRRCDLLSMGVYLFDKVGRSELIDVLYCSPEDTITTPLFRLLIALSRAVASAKEQEPLKRWFSRTCVHITKHLSIHDRLSDQVLDLCKEFGLGLSSKSIPKTMFDPVLLNALLESIFRKHIDEPHSTLLAASIVSTDIVKDVDFRKFLQIILSHPRNPLQDYSTTLLGSCLNIAYIIGRLFHANPESQASPTTIQQILTLTRGSNGVVDSVLESISAAYVRTTGKTLFSRNISYSFSDEGENRLFRFVNNKLHISISPRRLAQTITNYPANRPRRFRDDEPLDNFLAGAMKVNTAYSDSYSHFFLYKAIANWLNHEDSLVDLREITESGCVGFIMMGLCSADLSGRMTALKILEALVAKLIVSKDEIGSFPTHNRQASKYSEREGVAFLARALIHTAKGAINSSRLPTPLATFAARASVVQADPLHHLYPKVNEFLLLGPAWDLGKLPLFNTTLFQEPIVDDCYYQEVSWTLENLVSGLRTVEAAVVRVKDLNMYRRNHYFEHLCSMYWSPFLPATLRNKILDVLFAATDIEGGSTTLITRAGMMDWINLQLREDGDGGANDVRLRRLATRLYESCNREHVDGWSMGTMAARVQMMKLDETDETGETEGRDSHQPSRGASRLRA
ncbi:hypothetical protein GP486_003057 [Trichoglossum hirsutum]|uniref:Ribosome biogenesis protein Urb1 n=1 Tax=Trichoglossum hirsutum TaxID=265104 RepID=A0A9P8LDX1_9PEZI|nr:hypothetical protein GP486_003057 [Trichoglossum hirsutum]